MAEKILNTRLQLKIDTFANWSLSNATTQAKKTNGDFVLKHGEIGLCEIKGNDSIQTVDPNGLSKTQILFKVGDGTTPFKNLQWASALAADVYAWAKENKITITKVGTGNVVSGIEWDATANGGKGGIKFTTAAVATAEGLEELQGDVSDLEKEVYGEGGTKDNSRIDKLEKDIADNREVWAKDDNTTYTFAKTTDGKGITITPSTGNGTTISFAFLTKAEIEALNYLVAADITTGSANGTIAVEGTDVKVKGLQDAAYTTVSALNETAKGYADAVEAKIPTTLGVMSVAKGDDTITIGGTAANPTIKVTENKFDAYGAAAKALADAKDYANKNDANTEYHVEYDSTNKKIKLVAGADASKMEIDATAFIKDGMINTVSVNADHDLVITFNTDAGKSDIVVPLDELIDIYTGVNGTTVNVGVSSDNKISAEIKTGSLKDGHIAADAAIAKSKLAADVQTSLGKADTAIQAADLGDLAYVDTIIAEKVSDFATEVAKVKVTSANTADSATKATQDGNGKNIASTYATKSEATYTGDGNISVQGNQIALSTSLTGLTSIIGNQTFSVAAQESVSIGSEFCTLNVGHEDIKIQSAVGSDTGATIDLFGTGELNITAKDVNINGKPVHAIATSGNVNDLEQTAGDVLVFNCGTSTTVI